MRTCLTVTVASPLTVVIYQQTKSYYEKQLCYDWLQEIYGDSYSISDNWGIAKNENMYAGYFQKITTKSTYHDIWSVTSCPTNEEEVPPPGTETPIGKKYEIVQDDSVYNFLYYVEVAGTAGVDRHVFQDVKGSEYRRTSYSNPIAGWRGYPGRCQTRYYEISEGKYIVLFALCIIKVSATYTDWSWIYVIYRSWKEPGERFEHTEFNIVANPNVSPSWSAKYMHEIPDTFDSNDNQVYGKGHFRLFEKTTIIKYFPTETKREI